MPAYLISLADQPGVRSVLKGGADAVVVFAGDVTDARAVAKAHMDGDADGPWDNATVTQLAAASDLSDQDFALHIGILGTDPVIDVTAQGGVNGATGVAINDAGTGYVFDDILTVGGGTSSRPCLLRVTSEAAGIIDGIAVEDPGEYTAEPSNPVSVTGGNGNNDATFNLTFTTLAYENYLAEVVGLLNANAAIAGAQLQLAALTPLLTIAGAGDNLGDKTLLVEFLMNASPIPGLLGTVTDGGSAGSALTVEIPASPVLPNLVKPVKVT